MSVFSLLRGAFVCVPVHSVEVKREKNLFVVTLSNPLVMPTVYLSHARSVRASVALSTDNKAFQLSAVKGWSKAERLASLTKQLFLLSIKYEVVLQFVWVSTHENVFADALSRRDGEEAFLRMAAEQQLFQPGVEPQRDPRCGQTRTFHVVPQASQTGVGYSANTLRDGPSGGHGSSQELTVPYMRASIFCLLYTSPSPRDS